MGASAGLPGPRESQQCHIKPSLVTIAPSFLPSFPCSSFHICNSHMSPELYPGPFQKVLRNPPLPPSSPAMQGSQEGAFGEEGCPRDAALLGNRHIYISVCD